MKTPNLTRRRSAVLLAVCALLALGGTIGSIVLRADRTPQFPHELHARLFPLCTGCHEGVETGDRAAFYPSPQLCQNCHDGVDMATVEWTGPREHVTNLVFEHTIHQSQVMGVEGQPLECEQCHTQAGQQQRMVIERANPATCLSCHAHEATDHYVDANCQTCHVSFVRSELPPQRLPGLPLPDDHRVPGFLAEAHGPQAQANITRCSVCHTQERCTSCHVDLDNAPEILAIPAAPATWELPAYAVQYPLPPSHLSRQWTEQHGPLASRAQCATCHVREDCTACHVQPYDEVIAAFPARADVNAPGTGTERQKPLSHASRWFERDHAGVAASQPQSCNACHVRKFCTDCHDAPAEATFHPRNFTAQHSAAAYSQRMECSTCHEVRTFCRACHLQQGMQAVGRLGPGFHDAEPFWLLRHARAARQGLESCTSCHTQSDCMQCHSQLGAFQVSPHGPGFDARRAYSRNPVICSACHVSNPLNGRSGR
jgi:predicted CXXCH cytochrome family protein